MPSIDVKGARVAYAAAGSGETVLLLHSSAGSGAQSRLLTEVLQARWRVLAPDLHGYGQSDQRPGPASPGLADAAARLTPFLPRALNPSISSAIPTAAPSRCASPPTGRSAC